jgi:hypothetical protein
LPAQAVAAVVDAGVAKNHQRSAETNPTFKDRR